MADGGPVDPKGISIKIERGDELESAELDAALEQLAQALATLDVPQPIESDEDEVQGFNYFKMEPGAPGLKLGDVMGTSPRFEGPGSMGWCLGRCGSNSGDSCKDYCWVDG